MKHLDDAHKFFFEIAPAITVASLLSEYFARKSATRFNIFDYLRTDEIGLSKIFADLLNPSAKHGQGTLFLETFLELIPNGSNLKFVDSDQVKVRTEYPTDSGRSIDIWVEIGQDDERFILAVENKPYAVDSENQILDYLKFLDKLSETFRLLFLSPDGRSPSTRSIPNCERERWSEQLILMSYADGEIDHQMSEESEIEFSSTDDEAQFHLCKVSFAGWLSKCRERCQVDKLRWILKDAENFCLREFQDSETATDEEVVAVKDFLLQNRQYIKTAQTVHDSWRSVVNHVAVEFFELLCEKFKERVSDSFDNFNDLELKPVFAFNNGYSNLSLYRKSWRLFKNENDRNSERCRIVLGDDIIARPDRWFIGVRTPYQSNAMAGRLHALITDCKRQDPNWPAYKYLDIEYRDWAQITPRLVEELESRNGEISDYYVEQFLEFARVALPIVDEEELEFHSIGQTG